MRLAHPSLQRCAGLRAGNARPRGDGRGHATRQRARQRRRQRAACCAPRISRSPARRKPSRNAGRAASSARRSTSSTGRATSLPLEDAAGQELTVRNTLPTDTDVSLTMLCAKRESPPVIATATVNPDRIRGPVRPVSVRHGARGSGDQPRRERASGRTTSCGSTAPSTWTCCRTATRPVRLPRSSSSRAIRSSTCRRCGWPRAAWIAAGLETIVQSVATAPGGSLQPVRSRSPDGYRVRGHDDRWPAAATVRSPSRTYGSKTAACRRCRPTPSSGTRVA